MSEAFQFIVPARLQYREPIQAFVTALCATLIRQGLLSETEGHQVVSALNEAYNNACEHAPPDAAGLRIDVEPLDDRLRLVVRDRGSGFLLHGVREPDLDTLPESGMGVFIIRTFMDEVSVQRDGEWNALVMEKYFDSSTRNPT